MKIQFWGAIRHVTGSMHILSVNGKQILLECGLFQGRRQESFEKNLHFPFDPASISAMILSHAHIDHSGNIPQLVKQGFTGNIYCTHATHDLVRIMLRDSAHIQERDAEFLNKKAIKQGKPLVTPLYTLSDVETALNRLVSIGYHLPFPIAQGVTATFWDAGHILGSAIVQLDIEENGHSTRIVFTGDLGRRNLPVIRDPEYIPWADIFITESTYGNRIHEPIEEMKTKLKEVVQRTVARKGKIIIPAFSVGRTQEIVYLLHILFNEGSLPQIPIFVDSPLSANATEIFRIHVECFDEETKQKFLNQAQDPFGFYRLQYIRDVEESKKLNSFKEPCIIISASGMCETGRILHHLSHGIMHPENTILIVSFMAIHTLGRRLVEKAPYVRILGEEYPVRAEIVVMNGFSAHADQKELTAYSTQLDQKKLKQVFVVHGESEQSEALVKNLQEHGISQASIPVEGELISL